MKTIVFLCVENSCRSQIAEAFAKINSGGEYNIQSAGSRPSGTVNPKAINSMSRVGYDLNTHHSKGIETLPMDGVEAMISMGCGDACPQVPAKQKIEWEIADPKDMDHEEFDKVRDIIQAKVENFLESLDNG